MQRSATRRSLRTTAAAIATAALLLGAAGCAPDQAAPGGELVWVIEGGNLANGHMDPHSSQLDVSAYTLRNVYDSLVFLNADGTFEPWLATEWAVSDDQRTYTFQLRQDVTFHDGTRFDAAAAVRNFEHIFAPETASAQAASSLGGERFAGAEATGEFELTLRLKDPFGPLLTNLSTAFVGFISPKVLDSASQDALRAGGPEVTVGTGPFKLNEYVPNQRLVFDRNEAYAWAPASLAQPNSVRLLDRLVVRIVPEESARYGALTSGQAQVATDVSQFTVDQLMEQADQPQSIAVNVSKSPGMPYSAILNWGRDVFADERVRDAFRLGINVEEAVFGVYRTGRQRAWSALSPSTPNAYDASLEGKYGYDPARAEALLDEAGWTERDADGYRVKNGKRLTAEWLSWLPFDDEKRALVNFFIADLKEIGFELRHEAVEGGEYQARYADGNGMILDFDITDWGFASLDADILRNHLHSKGYQNASQVADPALDALLEQAATLSAPEERATIYRQIQQWNAEHVAYVPIVPSTFEVLQIPSGVLGLQYDAYGWPLFHGVPYHAVG